MQPSMDVRSSPSQRFDTRAVPSAMELRRMARWEMDLSPGSFTSPLQPGRGSDCLFHGPGVRAGSLAPGAVGPVFLRQVSEAPGDVTPEE